ncbi:FecR family protein [Steroidobacter sp.]|uniref:FecR family protein n=1 Tax=Steroidobacter sp. TaxID=1978227 RepID=UPI001A49E60D|nr:FecR domain-containing protein [Steroidobacter sp.]MBL8265978.1 FecR domain-containing protein [Steroidobacter sp.]
MSERETAKKVEQAAIEWLARRDGGDWNETTQREFDAWLAGDERRVGAVTRAEAAWDFMSRARALSGGRSVEEIQRIASLAARRRFFISTGVGVALAASVAMLALLLGGAERYGTELGEIRQVALTDGSRASLNSQSQLKASMRAEQRDVELEAGEAFFEVAKDAARPFIVKAGSVRVKAVGTAFSVRKREHGVDVLVTEGVVSTWIAGDEDKALRLAAGARAFVTEQNNTTVLEDAPTEIARALSWRVGEISLEGQTLANAAAEFNRYNPRRIVIDDPTLGARQLVGRFRVNEPEEFARAVVSTLDARMEVSPDTIRLVPRK